MRSRGEKAKGRDAEGKTISSEEHALPDQIAKFDRGEVLCAAGSAKHCSSPETVLLTLPLQDDIWLEVARVRSDLPR